MWEEAVIWTSRLPTTVVLWCCHGKGMFGADVEQVDWESNRCSFTSHSRHSAVVSIACSSLAVFRCRRVGVTDEPAILQPMTSWHPVS